MEVSKKRLVGGLAWIPLGLLTLANLLYTRPALMGLPFGEAIAKVVIWIFLLPAIVSISYAVTLVLGPVVLAILCVIVITCGTIIEWTYTSWMEGTVRVPSTPLTAFTAVAGAVRGLPSMIHTAGQAIRGRVTTEPPETTELDDVRTAYARGEISDLQMEQQIDAILEKNRQEDDR